MYSLKSSDPVVWDAFSAGEFSVQKTAIPFTALGMDHAGEQVNKILKIEGGLTGVSRNENARTRYFLTAPLISQIASNFRDKNNEKKHHQNNKTYSKRQSEMKEKLCSVLRQYNVTFDNNMEAKMHNFITKQVFSDEIKKDVISVESIGKAQYKMFVDERLSEESNISVWAPVHKLNLNVCSKANKKTRLKVEDKLVEVTGQRLLFSRCAVVANSSRDLDMKSVVGDYELDVVPRSLMASDGSLHSGSENKSDLIERITNNYSAISCSPEPEMIAYRVAIIDAMVVVQKIAAQDQRAVKSQKIKTCLDFSNAFLNRISTLIKGFQEVRVVFDFYDSLSLKNATREKRGSTSGATRFIVDDNTRISSSVSQILKDIHTKQDLTVYLAEKSRTFLNKEGVRHLVSANHETLGNLPCSDVINNHEEADTLMIWHCIHFSLTSPNSSSLTVFSPDTDVACLLISFKKHMIQNVYLDTGNHIICINSVHQCLGERKADALLSLHALSGCDTTGRFLGKGKKAWWNVFNKCTDEQLLAISSIQSENPLNHIDLIEEVIAMLYCPKSTSIRDARWDLFRKRYHESERLPPTKGSIKQAVLRAHCQARPWYLSDKSVRTIPDPLECGWEICEGTYVAITSDHPIAPDLVINLVKCGCNSECLTNRCKCGKNKLVCTGLCECNDTCENTDTERFTNDDNLDEEEMFEEMLL